MDIKHSELLSYFQSVRTSTLAFLATLPADILEQEPPAGQSLADSIRHIAFAGDYWCHEVFKDGKGESVYTRENCDGPAALKDALEKSALRLIECFSVEDGAAFATEFQTSWGKAYGGTDRLLYLTAHEIHHRGRAVQVARQFGWSDKVKMPL